MNKPAAVHIYTCAAGKYSAVGVGVVVKTNELAWTILAQAGGHYALCERRQ